jgi:hypothetical protein
MKTRIAKKKKRVRVKKTDIIALGAYPYMLCLASG